jgi:predicted O-methyltransferase YrrM
MTQPEISPALWSAVDRYLVDTIVPTDAALQEATTAAEAAGLPAISVSANQGKFLSLLATIRGARNILEIGTLAGYSAIWLARALPSNGRLVTLEADSKHAEVARANIARAGLAGLVDVRVGLALDTLPQLAEQGNESFDLVFIDADKANIPAYFEWALRLTKPGSVIVVDNVVRRGAILDASSESPEVQGIRRFNELVASDPRVTATALQTVGSKGYDGFALVLVTNR